MHFKKIAEGVLRLKWNSYDFCEIDHLISIFISQFDACGFLAEGTLISASVVPQPPGNHWEGGKGGGAGDVAWL